MAGFKSDAQKRTMIPMIELSTLQALLGPASAPLAGLGPILATWVGAILVKGTPGGRS